MSPHPPTAVPLRQGLLGMLTGAAALIVTRQLSIGPLLGIWLLVACCSAPMFAMERESHPSADLNRALLWTLKLFFVPVYSVILFFNLAMLVQLKGLPALVLAVYSIDLAFAVVGYLFASARTFYSVQPLGIGWIVCIICYPPFVFQFSVAARILGNETSWPQQLPNAAVAVPMLALLALYFSATVVFGMRFSNLGYRGVITNGPYRWMKHPAYFCHASFAWMTVFFFVPLSASSLAAATVLTVVYRLRAITEERHLRRYREYLDYCDWIAEHGAIATVRRLLTLTSGSPCQSGES